MMWLKKKKEKKHNSSEPTIKTTLFLPKKRKKDLSKRRLRRFRFLTFFSFSLKKVRIVSVVLLVCLAIIFLKNVIPASLYVSPLPLGTFFQMQEENYTEKQIASALHKKSISYTKIEVSEPKVKILLKENGEVYLSTEKDISDQIASLQFILSRLTMEGRRFRSLDLRFENPVIVLTN